MACNVCAINCNGLNATLDFKYMRYARVNGNFYALLQIWKSCSREIYAQTYVNNANWLAKSKVESEREWAGEKNRLIYLVYFVRKTDLIKWRLNYRQRILRFGNLQITEKIRERCSSTVFNEATPFSQSRLELLDLFLLLLFCFIDEMRVVFSFQI